MNYSDLIQTDKVHGGLYQDSTVFEEEMTRIFMEGWVFVGHESEIPTPGDWVARRLGLEPVLMVRQQDGTIGVLANRCAHRGTTLCPQSKGNTGLFRCSFHGWSFSLDGALQGVPGPEGMVLDKSQVQLDRPGAIAAYRGFIFANQSGTAGPLDDHLGPGGKMLIDRAADMSPTGKLNITAGWIPHDTECNWKMWVESDNDGYHLKVAHGSLARAVPGTQYESALFDVSEKNTSQARDHGMGHVELELRTGYDRELAWLGTDRSKVPEYCEALIERHGEVGADRILWDGPPHALIFPNLFLGEMNLAIIQPISPNRTIHYHTPLLLDGVEPSFNQRVMRQSEGAMGPGSFFLPDDAIIAERMQQAFAAGLQAEHGWTDMSRGLNRERTDELSRVGHVSDETINRGFWHHYRNVMENSDPRSRKR